jgi:hypothetical protein
MQTGARPNLFTRWFFGIAELLHQPVYCSDEDDIWEALRLHKLLRIAKKHESRCVSSIARHVKKKPVHI